MLRRNTGDYMVLHQYDSPPLSVCIWTVYAIIFQRKLGIPKKTSRRRALPIWSKFFGNFGSAVNGESFVALSPWKIPRKKWKIWKGRPVFPVGTFRTEFHVPFSIVTNSAAILVSHRVTGSAPFRGLRSNRTTFYLSENPFLFPAPKFPNFFSKWKASNILPSKLHVGFFKIIKNNSEYNDVKSDFFAIRNDGQFKLI